MGLWGQAQYHQPRGFHIEAMRGEKALCPGEELAHPRYDAILAIGSASRHGEEIRELVDYYEALFVVHDRERAMALVRWP